MYEVRVGAGKNSRQIFASEDQIEAINYARKNLYRYGGLPVNVTHHRPIGSVGRTVPHIVWESRPGEQPEGISRPQSEEEKALEANRHRRQLMRAMK